MRTFQSIGAALILLSADSLAAPAHHHGQCKSVDAGFDPQKVMSRALNLSSHSWEYGTAAEAYLELTTPEYSVFNSKAFPHGKVPRVPATIPSLAYAKPNIRTNNQTLIDGDGASGDPAALGVSAILLGQSDKAYFDAATREKQHLLTQVPRMSNGAISQRDSNVAAWADFMFMAPPFLAYYAVATNDVGLLRETVRQCGLYRQLLQVNGTYWQHIVVQDNSGGADSGIWSTGNGWAAGGMVRVLATLQNWEGQNEVCSTERAQLVGYIKEIIDGAMSSPLDKGLLRNYLNDTTWFGENSGTALLASVTYRMAVLAPEVFGKKYISWADKLRKVVATYVQPDGTISPNVNPLGWGDRNPFVTGSPEGQSFGVFLYTSYRDCVCAGKCS